VAGRRAGCHHPGGVMAGGRRGGLPAAARYPVADGLGRGNAGSFDAQALTAAATFGLAGFSPFRKRSARGEAEGWGVGRAVGLVAGIASPWLAMHVRKAVKAAPNPPRPPKPPLGRSDAHACRAFIIAELGLGNAVGLAVGRVLGRVVGTVTPCWRRQVRYALALGLGEAAAVAAAVGVADVPQPEASTATNALPAMAPRTRTPRSAFLGARERGHSLLDTEFSSGHRSAPRSPKAPAIL
jgi:hypothetical protein